MRKLILVASLIVLMAGAAHAGELGMAHWGVMQNPDGSYNHWRFFCQFRFESPEPAATVDSANVVIWDYPNEQYPDYNYYLFARFRLDHRNVWRVTIVKDKTDSVKCVDCVPVKWGVCQIYGDETIPDDRILDQETIITMSGRAYKTYLKDF